MVFEHCTTPVQWRHQQVEHRYWLTSSDFSSLRSIIISVRGLFIGRSSACNCSHGSELSVQMDCRQTMSIICILVLRWSLLLYSPNTIEWNSLVFGWLISKLIIVKYCSNNYFHRTRSLWSLVVNITFHLHLPGEYCKKRQSSMVIWSRQVKKRRT